MLKMAASPKRSIFDKLKVDNGKNDDSIGGVEIAKKLETLKGQKLSKFRKLAKLKKNLSKIRNSSNFDIKNDGLSFLTPKTRAMFNHLRLAFIKALIF